MARKRRNGRVYLREGRGYYMDLRDKGGGRCACIPEGNRYATHDLDEAHRICQMELERLDSSDPDSRRGHRTLLREYASEHLQWKSMVRRQSTVQRDERALRKVLEFFGQEVHLSEVTVQRLTEYVAHRQSQPGVKAGTKVAAQTILHELSALSSLFKTAMAHDRAKSNPVSAMPFKPSIEREESEWLEVGEAAELIHAAREMDAETGRRMKHFEALVAFPLLTSARFLATVGMEVSDVDFTRKMIRIRPNRFRKLKTKKSDRRVPLWPQLEKILREHIETLDGESSLLFPGPGGGLWKDVRGSLNAACDRADIKKHVTFNTLRHTYAGTRIQTLDNGAPVSIYTVAKEMGHSSIGLIESTYGHLQETRHRSSVVEYVHATIHAISGERSA